MPATICRRAIMANNALTLCLIFGLAKRSVLDSVHDLSLVKFEHAIQTGIVNSYFILYTYIIKSLDENIFFKVIRLK